MQWSLHVGSEVGSQVGVEVVVEEVMVADEFCLVAVVGMGRFNAVVQQCQITNHISSVYIISYHFERQTPGLFLPTTHR